VVLKGTGFDPEPWFSKNFQRTGQKTADLCQIFEGTHWFFEFFQKPITIDSYFILTSFFQTWNQGPLRLYQNQRTQSTPVHISNPTG
jgi:hypothetical protein